MKSLQILRTLVDIFLFYAVLGALTALFIVPMIIIDPSAKIPVTIKGIDVVGDDWLSILVIILGAISAFFFVYAIFILRRVLILFQKNEIFTDKVIGYFRTIGKFIVISTLLSSLPLFFYNVINRGNIKIEFGAGFDSMLLWISLGLLFIVIAEIFNRAKLMKDENELTV